MVLQRTYGQTMTALGKPLDLVSSHLPCCKPNGYFSYKDYMILISPPVASAKLSGHKGRNSHVAGVSCAAVVLTCTRAVGVCVWHIPGQGEGLDGSVVVQ